MTERGFTPASCTRREFLMLGSSLYLAMGSFRRTSQGRPSARPDRPNQFTAMEARPANRTMIDEMLRVTSKDGTRIGFLKRGVGPPIVFVHGTTADHRSWARFAPHVEDHLTVYAMDRRGRGESGDAPEYAFEREVEDVIAVVEAISAPACLFGHSFGGLCSLEAARKSDRIRRLILYEPPVPTGVPTVPEGVPERLQDLVDRGELESAMEVFLREVAEIPDHELEAYRRSPLWEARIPLASTISRELAVERTYRFDEERFAGFHVPTMLLLGGDSPSIYRQGIETLAAALPNSEVVVLPGQQHLAHHSDPGLLAGEVLRFVTGGR